MSQSSNIKLFTLSLLCGAVLTACGGGGGETDSIFLGDNTKDNNNTPTTPNDSATSPPVVGDDGKLLPVGDGVIPTTRVFLSNMPDIGQQQRPKVAVINNNDSLDPSNNHRIANNQAAIVSEICAYGGENCSDPNLEKLKERAQEDIAEAQKALATEQGKDNPDSNREDQLSMDLKNAKDKLKQIEDVIPRDGVIVMRDVNNRILQMEATGTVDVSYLSPLSPIVQGTILEQDPDAGITKIEYEKKGNKYIPYGGTIEDQFNGVVMFKLPLIDGAEYINAYMRDPAMPGWSYQTFGVYGNEAMENNRDLIIGYQSIGQATPNSNMPNKGRATYTGISHAYYNKNQVTSENEITADFGKKELTYTTKAGTTYLHTFGTRGHVIEQRSDLAVNGTAKWERANDFKGDVSTENGLKGTIEGQFYGDKLQEVGGVYGLRGTVKGKTVDYVGGFGGKRP